MNKLAEEIGILEEMIENANIENMDMNDCFGGEHIEAMQHILSEYKRVLKENEELKEDRKNNNEMIALAQNEILNYMSGYEEGKKHKMTAVAQVVENQQYYIVRKQMEKYEEHIKRLQKENEELKEENEYNKILLDMNNNFTIDKKNGNYKWNVIEIQKVKDKIEKLKNISNAEELEDIMNRKNYTITELVQYILQELLAERKEN